MSEARKVLDRLAEAHGGVRFSYSDYEWSCAYFLKTVNDARGRHEAAGGQ